MLHRVAGALGKKVEIRFVSAGQAPDEPTAQDGVAADSPGEAVDELTGMAGAGTRKG